MPRSLRLVIAAVLLAAAPAASGCAWADARRRDLADVIDLEVGIGLGVAVDVTATDLAAVGAGAAWSETVGLRDGALGRTEGLVLGLPVAPVTFLAARENGSALIAPPTLLTARLAEEDWTDARPVGRTVARGSTLVPALTGAASPDRPWHRAADLEARVTAGIATVRVGFSPGELLDLLAGLIGLDPAGDDAPAGPAEAPPGAEPGARWIAADLHLHASPPDADGHARLDPEEVVALARSRGVEALAFAPHLWPSHPGRWGYGGRGRGLTRLSVDDGTPAEAVAAFAELGRRLATTRDDDGPIVLTGWEESYGGGHVGVLGADMADALGAGAPPPEPTSVTMLDGGARMETFDPQPAPFARALDAGGVAVIHHPLLRRFAIPFAGRMGVPGFGPWLRSGGPSKRDGDPGAGWIGPSGHGPSDAALRDRYTAAEAFNLTVDAAECAFLLPREERSVERVLRRLDREMLTAGRRIGVTGGSDDHLGWVLPGCWLLVADRSPEGVLDAIRRGRVVLGRPHASSFAARSDRETTWQPIGADLAADRRVQLRWAGPAELWIDGANAGTFRDGHVHEIERGSAHVYRIVIGESRSGWIRVNLGG